MDYLINTSINHRIYSLRAILCRVAAFAPGGLVESNPLAPSSAIPVSAEDRRAVNLR